MTEEELQALILELKNKLSEKETKYSELETKYNELETNHNTFKEEHETKVSELQEHNRKLFLQVTTKVEDTTSGSDNENSFSVDDVINSFL